MAEIIRERIEPEAGYLDYRGKCRVYLQNAPFGLTAQEVEGFATTSCNAQLWAFRALCYRLGVPVVRADWVFYNK
jgi:hypothetical protein